MKNPFAARANTQILEEASAWFIEVSEGDLNAGTREAFNRWLRSSPEHVRAYLETAAVWENAALIDKTKRHDAEALIAMASGSANVFPLEMAVAATSVTAAPSGSRRILLAASFAVLLLCAGILSWLQLADSKSYSTDIGEQHSIALADGSTVTLNSSSRIRVNFTSDRRDIELLRGQALFDVAQDRARPFVVSSGETQVTALGTQFDVNLRQRGIVVTVLEGRVSVSSSILSAGEQITVVPKAKSRAVSANLAAATAWTQRRLVFSSTPLNEVAEEYNRYHKRRLVIRDREVEALNISGTFSSTDAASLIDFLREQPGVQVRETSSEIEIASK